MRRPETNLVCKCGRPLKLDFVNKSNRGVNTLVLKYPRCSTSYIDVPLNRIQSLLRNLKSQFDNRENSLRNRIFNLLHLCTCTNTIHGHREGIHNFNLKGKGVCSKCLVLEEPWREPYSEPTLEDIEDMEPEEIEEEKRKYEDELEGMCLPPDSQDGEEAEPGEVP